MHNADGRLLEQLALHRESSIAQLARESHLSYPTALHSASSLPVLSLQKVGREKRVQIKDDSIDVVYPFLISLKNNKQEKMQLTLAYLARKGFENAMLAGEAALQLQLNVKDAEPNPVIEIRTNDPSELRRAIKMMLGKTLAKELMSNTQVIRDGDLSAARNIGLVKVSRPEKLLVDAIAENKSEVLVENIAESIVNSNQDIDMHLLYRLAESRNVLGRVLDEITKARESGFP